MVEIVKVLLFELKVIIMDELIDVLIDIEIEFLFNVINELCE